MGAARRGLGSGGCLGYELPGRRQWVSRTALGSPRGRETDSHVRWDGVPVRQSEFLKGQPCLPAFLLQGSGLNERLRE